MKTLLLIDAHALIHRSFHALPPLTAPDGRPAGALYGLASTLMKTLAAAKPDYIAAAFDRPEPTLRKQEYKEYKAHRPPAPDELISQLQGARELFLTFGIPCFEKPGYEGDDIVGTLAKKFGKDDIHVEILTGDLDTLQLVEDDHIVVRTMKKGVSDTFVYDEAAVKERYGGLLPSQLADYKGLVGDTSDNIPGVKGVGPKTATELLLKFGTLEKIYREADPKEKMAAKVLPYEKEALFSRKLGTIDTAVPLPATTLDSLAFSGIPSDMLAPYFTSLGFESLLRRMGVQDAKAAKAPKEKPAAAPSLFASSKTKEAPETPLKPTAFFLDTNDALGRRRELESDRVKAAPEWKPIMKELREAGVAVKDPLFDLSVAGWLLNPDGGDFSPEALAARYAPRRAGETPKALIEALTPILARELKQEGLMHLFQSLEMPLIRVLADMERSGIGVDTAALKRLAEDIDRETESAARRIYDIAGGAFNLNSPKQVGDVLFERLKLKTPKVRKTSTGQRRTGRDILESLKGSHPIVDLILSYREDFKVRSSFVTPLIELAGPDGRVHTSFLQTSTGTGRLSSEKPNLQNIPQESRWAPRLRESFVAPAGSKLLSLDYSQIELRLLAHVTGDAGLLAAFKAGKDIHATTASKIFHVPEEEVTKEMRRVAKTLNFGVVYGMGARAFAETSGFSLTEAKRFIDDYFGAFPAIKRWQEEVKERARSAGFIANANGRKRWFPSRGGQDRPGGRVSGEFDRAAINMPLQSLGADILKMAMLQTFAAITGKGWSPLRARLILSVHDELLFEIRDDILNESAPLLQAVMERVYPLSVPLLVGVSYGASWGALQPLSGRA